MSKVEQNNHVAYNHKSGICKISSNPNHGIKSMEIKSNPVGIREII